MRVEHLTPHIGSLVHDVDLAALSDTGLGGRLRSTLHERGVLFFRDQTLAATELLALAQLFGTPVASPHPKFGCVDGRAEVSLIVNDAEHPPDINVWHSDLSYHTNPATTCVLYCRELPPVGGDTLWASMTAAYDALSSTMKSWVSGLSAYHQLPLDGYPPGMISKALSGPIGAIHPVVRRIPETGRRSLYVNRVYTHRIEGLSAVESAGVLQMLCTHAESPDFQVRFRWSKDAVAIWDNRTTQHYAVADYFPARRVMHRVALRGEAVVT